MKVLKESIDIHLEKLNLIGLTLFSKHILGWKKTAYFRKKIDRNDNREVLMLELQNKTL